MTGNYWDKFANSRISRRRAIAATGATAAGALLLAACGGDDKGGDTGTKEPAASTTGKLDASKGVPGGKLIWQSYGDPGGGLELIKIRNPGVYNMASFTHDGLLDYAYGVQGYPGIGAEVLPSIATALPETSPDKLTQTFKIRTGVKFHNGDPMTSADVKWTYDTLAFGATSAWKGDFPFIESTSAPDATTFVVKTKYPFADFAQAMTMKNAGSILSQRHQESADAEKKLVGTGPYTFVEYTPPTITRYKKNPDYWGKPLGFFDEVERLGTADKEKMLADFVAKQVHVTYWFTPQERDRIKQSRSDALLWKWTQAAGHNFYMRNDKAPFTDKRVRQAMSMSIDRKSLVGPMTNGEGQIEGLMSVGAAWKFRLAADLGANAKNFEYNLTTAKQLLSAAGVQLPINLGPIPTWDATVIGPAIVDAITLITTNWKNNGIATATLKEENFGQFIGRLNGVYDLTAWGPNTEATNPDVGNTLKTKYYWADGDKPPLNDTWIKNPALNTLLDKQIAEFDKTARQKIFTDIEDLLSDEMPHIPTIVGNQNYFGDPSLKNAQMGRDAYNGAFPWFKYWWFDKKV
ncbi:MAG TPA: ABC transporter substrate-binding protein [Dehalococcoidia bacterium]|nr:ABC transporter substrate-binding protein [Dehalococcoidia bacterium]